MKIIHRMKTKLKEAKAIVTKADKGNSIVIIQEAEYNNKIHTFISSNAFGTSNKDITKKQQQKSELPSMNAQISYPQMKEI
jgi:hypothetical protein